ncbi:MAG TPA: hypothetical protein VMA53_27905 [Stellaceae bacterium]|nr:hypothetical protein [Stellaceae bacterium]
MRRTNRVSHEGSRPVLVRSADETTGFIEPPAPANDAEFAPPQSSFEPDRLVDTVRATASRAMQETLLGFALYGAALYPYFGDPSWMLDRDGPDEPLEFTWLAAEARRREAWLAAAPTRSTSDRQARRTRSLLARLRTWMVGSAWAGD